MEEVRKELTDLYEPLCRSQRACWKLVRFQHRRLRVIQHDLVQILASKSCEVIVPAGLHCPTDCAQGIATAIGSSSAEGVGSVATLVLVRNRRICWVAFNAV